LLKFHDDITHGRIKPYLRNEKDVPESTGLVKKVNNETLRQIFADNHKSASIMLILTHPTYPVMLESLPVMEKVAEANRSFDGLQFYTMDLSKNDVPLEVTQKFTKDLMHINLFVNGEQYKPLTSMEVTEYHVSELLAEHLNLPNTFTKPEVDPKANIDQMMSETSEYNDDMLSMSKEGEEVPSGETPAFESKDDSSDREEQAL